MAKKERIFFVDENGMEWDMVHIKALIRGYQRFNDFFDTCRYYRHYFDAMLKMKPRKEKRK
jgi:hypothetical protein